MKAKISIIDPTGCSEKEVDFYIPLIKKELKPKYVKFEDGKTMQIESMKHERYLLEIGEFQYWIYKNGKIIIETNE
jgi:hypothetical protein